MFRAFPLHTASRKLQVRAVFHLALAAMQRRRAAQHGVVDRLTSDAQRRQCVQQELARMRRLNDLPLACKLQASACVSSSVRSVHGVRVCDVAERCGVPAT